MSRADVHRYANKSTPSGVSVPNTVNGLALWVVGQFGAPGLISVVMFFFMQRMYEDGKATNRELLTAFKESVEVNQRTATTLEAIKIEFRDAHSRAVTVGGLPVSSSSSR